MTDRIIIFLLILSLSCEEITIEIEEQQEIFSNYQGSVTIETWNDLIDCDTVNLDGVSIYHSQSFIDMDYDFIENVRDNIKKLRVTIGDSLTQIFLIDGVILHDFIPATAAFTRSRDKKNVIIQPSEISFKVFLHEFGHYYERANLYKWRDRKQIIKSYEENKSKWSDIPQVTSWREYFAEAFQLYHIDPIQLIERDQETYLFIKKCMNL